MIHLLHTVVLAICWNVSALLAIIRQIDADKQIKLKHCKTLFLSKIRNFRTQNKVELYNRRDTLIPKSFYLLNFKLSFTSQVVAWLCTGSNLPTQVQLSCIKQYKQLLLAI